MKFYKEYNLYLNEQENKDKAKEEKSEKKPESTTPVATLQNELNKWTERYSQSFKFVNDRPYKSEATSKPDGQFDKLINACIVDDKKEDVKQSIDDIIDMLSNSKFDGKKIKVIGHTSTTGPKGREVPYNQALSIRRANITINAIKDRAKDSEKDISNIEFTPVGKGLTKTIVKNDKEKDNEPIIQNIDSGFDEKTMNALRVSSKERQKINRRVVISLPEFENKPEPKPENLHVDEKDTDVGIDTKEEKEEVELKDIKIDPSLITFHVNSYLLTNDAKKIIKKMADNLNNKEEVSMVSISAHADTGRDKTGNRDEAMFKLSLNRAFVVKTYLSNRIKEKHPNVEYNVYGCSDKISPSSSDYEGDIKTRRRVEILFDQDMEIAKDVHQELSKSYRVKDEDQIINNVELKKRILGVIQSYFENYKVRRIMMIYDKEKASNSSKVKDYFKQIPREYWTNTVYKDKGEKPDEFREDFYKFLRRLNSKHNVKIPANLFFNDDLRDNN